MRAHGVGERARGRLALLVAKRATVSKDLEMELEVLEVLETMGWGLGVGKELVVAEDEVA